MLATELSTTRIAHKISNISKTSSSNNNTNNNNNMNHPRPTNMMSRIVSASNIGAQCIIDGEYQRSIDHLSAAFEEARSLILREQASQSSCSRAQWTGELQSSNDTKLDNWMTKAPQEIDLCSQFIYMDPISIPSLLKADFHQHIVLISVVVSFNLGLAFVLDAQQRSQTNELKDAAQLHQALKLFQYSFRLQRARGRASQSPLFFMAAVNNIGVLYSILGEINKAEECFQQLLALIMYMNTVSAGVMSNYGVFFQNATRHSGTSRGLATSCMVAGAA